ncbi:MAG: DUF2283 domain-containing protein [Nitrospirae bacterium]|nr:DUF2283 domain-containing protein [Nitrospirota bacterium]
MPKITYDKETNITYIKLNNNEFHENIINGNCVLDVDKNGGIIGIEILDFNVEEDIKSLPPNFPNT